MHLLALILCVTGSCPRAHAQEPANATTEAGRDRGIQLYKQGDAKGAADALQIAVKQQKDDVSAWHYLGLAFEQVGDKGSAKKAFEKAAKLGENTLNRQLDKVSPSGKEIPRFALALQTQLTEAADSAERYVALALDSRSPLSQREEWAIRIGSLRGFADLAEDPSMKLYAGKEVTTKARILKKSEPSYTEKARQNQVSGTVILRCVLGANGTVFGFRVVNGLPDGLTEQAIRVARQIKFIPATKDGHPVSIWVAFEYNFNLY